MPEREWSFRITAKDNFSKTTKKLNKDLDQTGRKAKSTGKAFQAGTKQGSAGLKDMLSGVNLLKAGVAGFVASEAVQMVSALNELGHTANVNEAVFRQLTKTQGDFTDQMQILRDVTRGMIDDTALQAQTSQLLQMGLANTTEEAAELIDMAVTLGSAMGNDATQSIDDFTMMLANQSRLRLDTFGIASGKVRDRIIELIDAGKAANREEAFKMATMEFGAAAMERLGSAADAGSTGMVKLGTMVKNFTSSVGQGVNVGLNTVADMVLGAFMPGENAPTEIEEAWQTVLNDLKLEITPSLDVALADAGGIGGIYEMLNLQSDLSQLVHTALREQAKISVPMKLLGATKFNFDAFDTSSFDAAIDELLPAINDQLSMSGQDMMGRGQLVEMLPSLYESLHGSIREFEAAAQSQKELHRTEQNPMRIASGQLMGREATFTANLSRGVGSTIQAEELKYANQQLDIFREQLATVKEVGFMSDQDIARLDEMGELLTEQTDTFAEFYAVQEAGAKAVRDQIDLLDDSLANLGQVQSSSALSEWGDFIRDLGGVEGRSMRGFNRIVSQIGAATDLKTGQVTTISAAIFGDVGDGGEAAGELSRKAIEIGQAHGADYAASWMEAVVAGLASSLATGISQEDALASIMDATDVQDIEGSLTRIGELDLSEISADTITMDQAWEGINLATDDAKDNLKTFVTTDLNKLAFESLRDTWEGIRDAIAESATLLTTSSFSDREQLGLSGGNSDERGLVGDDRAFGAVVNELNNDNIITGGGGSSGRNR